MARGFSKARLFKIHASIPWEFLRQLAWALSTLRASLRELQRGFWTQCDFWPMLRGPGPRSVVRVGPYTLINLNREIYRLFMQSEFCNAFLSGKNWILYFTFKTLFPVIHTKEENVGTKKQNYTNSIYCFCKACIKIQKATKMTDPDTECRSIWTNDIDSIYYGAKGENNKNPETDEIWCWVTQMTKSAKKDKEIQSCPPLTMCHW